MSVVMYLYTVCDAVYKGNYKDTRLFNTCDNDKIDDVLHTHFNLPEDCTWLDADEWEKEQDKSAWSDGCSHIFYDFTSYTEIAGNKNRSWATTFKRVIAKYPYKLYHGEMKTSKYLCLDKALYLQGWYFKPRFFKRKSTVIICVTKQQMESFLRKYVRYTDKDGYAAANLLLSTWRDGMIFECSF